MCPDRFATAGKIPPDNWGPGMLRQTPLYSTWAVLAALALAGQPAFAQSDRYGRHHRPRPRPPHHQHHHRDNGPSTGAIVGTALAVGAVAAIAANAANNNRTSGPPVGQVPPPPAPSAGWDATDTGHDNDPTRDRAVESCVRQIELDGSEKIDTIETADPTSSGFTVHGKAVGDRTFACEVDLDGSTRRTLVTGADGNTRTWTGRSAVPEAHTEP